MSLNLGEFIKLSRADESNLRQRDIVAYDEYLLQKARASTSSRMKNIYDDTLLLVRAPEFHYLISPHEELALRQLDSSRYNAYSARKKEFEKTATQEEREQALFDVDVRKIMLFDNLSRESAVNLALERAIAANRAKVLSLDTQIRFAGGSISAEQIRLLREAKEVLENKIAGLEAAKISADPGSQIFKDGACQYTLLDEAEAFLHIISRNPGLPLAVNTAKQAFTDLENSGAEGIYFASQFLLFYLQNLVKMHAEHPSFQSPSAGIEALATLLSVRRGERLKRYRSAIDAIDSDCLPIKGYIAQIDSLLDNAIPEFTKRLKENYISQVQRESGPFGTWNSITMAGEAMTQFGEMGLLEESAFFQALQLEEFDKMFMEITDPEYDGLHLIDAKNGAESILRHLDDIKFLDERIHERFLKSENQSVVAAAEEILAKVDSMIEKFKDRLVRIEKKVRSGYDAGGSDAVVMAEKEVQAEIDLLEQEKAADLAAKQELEQEAQEISEFVAGRKSVHQEELEIEKAEVEELMQATIAKFQENMISRRQVEVQNAQAAVLLGKQKIDKITGIFMQAIDEVFAERVEEIKNGILPQTRSQSLGIFETLLNVGGFLLDNAKAISSLGTLGVAAFGTVEQLAIQKKIQELDEEIKTKQLELQEKVTNAQIRLLDVQTDSIEVQASIENEILNSQKELLLLQNARDKKIIEANSEFEILKAQIEASKQVSTLQEEKKIIDEILFIQDLEKNLQDERLKELEKAAESLSDAEILNFLNGEADKKNAALEELRLAELQRLSEAESRSESGATSMLPVALGIGAALFAIALVAGKKG